MSKMVLSFVERRARAAVKQAARERYERIGSGIDFRRKGVLVTSARAVRATVPTVVTRVRSQVDKPAPRRTGEHTTSVVPVGELFSAECVCGWVTTRPMGGASAKGMATKHRNSVTVVTGVAA